MSEGGQRPRAICRVCGEPITRTGDQWWHDDPTLNDDGYGRVDHDAWPPREALEKRQAPPR
jgi:hypothetical protein